MRVVVTVAVLVAIALLVLSVYGKLLGLRREVETAWRLLDRRRTTRHLAAAQVMAALAADQAGDPAAYSALVAAHRRAVTAQRMADAAAAEADLGTAAARITAALDRPGVPPRPSSVLTAVADLNAATVAFEEARTIYGLTVSRHNAALAVFPVSLLARVAGLEAAERLG
jgi:LemA protein